MLLLFVSWLVDTSARASATILLLLCLRPALRRWIGSRALAWLWVAVVARLLFPLPVSAPWRFPSLLPAPAPAVASPYHIHASVAAVETPATPSDAAPLPRPSLPRIDSRPIIFALLWLSGALLAAVRLARGWWITHRWSARTLSADIYPDLQSTYLALPTELRRRAGLRLTDALDVPTLVGVLRPQIWLPRSLPDTLTSAELRHVLLHELGHACRRDLLAQWLCSLSCCLHWFNPLVWLLARVARTDRELACDAWVLAHDAAKAEAAASYGHTLLKVVEGTCRSVSRALPAVSMAAGKRHLGLRVREIRAFRPVAPWRGAVALAAPVVLVAAFTLKGAVAVSDTDAASPTPQTAPSSPSPSPASPASVSPAPAASVPLGPASSARPVQVEVESKFIEITKSASLKLEKSAARSSPVASIFHQISARFSAPASSAIFRSSPVLPDDFQLLVRQLNQQKGVDLLSAPRVTTKSGQKATIEITREFIYPTAFERGQDPAGKLRITPTGFDKMNTGATLEVSPTIESQGDVIDLSLTWKITNFDGFVDADGNPTSGTDGKFPTFPTFDTRSVSTVASLSSGATVVFGTEEQHIHLRKNLRFVKGEEDRKTVPEKEDERLLLVFVTATLVHPPSGTGSTDDHPPSPTASQKDAPIEPSSPPANAPASSLPANPAPSSYGVPVPGRPGFVTSPYAPDAGYVDLRGFTRDQSIRDPYTGKMFLVP